MVISQYNNFWQFCIWLLTVAYVTLAALTGGLSPLLYMRIKARRAMRKLSWGQRVLRAHGKKK